MLKNNNIVNMELLKELNMDLDYFTTVCPYCKAPVIEDFERKAIRNGKWLQILHCNECNDDWSIIYREDQTIERIINKDISNTRSKAR